VSSLLFTVVVAQRVLFHKHIVMVSLNFTPHWPYCHGNENVGFYIEQWKYCTVYG